MHATNLKPPIKDTWSLITIKRFYNYELTLIKKDRINVREITKFIGFGMIISENKFNCSYREQMVAEGG